MYTGAYAQTMVIHGFCNIDDVSRRSGVDRYRIIRNFYNFREIYPCHIQPHKMDNMLKMLRQDLGPAKGQKVTCEKVHALKIGLIHGPDQKQSNKQ
jgi:hypothetical protein